jgi:hypothetical protein
MNRKQSPLPRNVSSWLSLRLLGRAIPGDLREAFLGDLLEEAQRNARPSPAQWRLRLWLWTQVPGSLPALLGLRITREGSMITRRLSAAALMIIMGMLQAWDSRVFQSSVWIIGMVVISMLLPVMAVLRSRHHDRFAWALAVTCICLVVARFISPTPIGSDLLTAVVVIWAASLLVFRPYNPRKQLPDDQVA